MLNATFSYAKFWSLLELFLKKILFTYEREREREREHKQGEEQRERRLPREQGAQSGAPSQNPGIMTWAEGRHLTQWATQVPLFQFSVDFQF